MEAKDPKALASLSGNDSAMLEIGLIRETDKISKNSHLCLKFRFLKAFSAIYFTINLTPFFQSNISRKRGIFAKHTRER